MTNHSGYGAVALALFLALTGCSADQSRTMPEHGVSTFPPPPISVSVDQLPPCSMLTSRQAASLELDEPRPGQVRVNGLPSPSCTWFGREVDYSVQYIPIEAETALTAPGAVVESVNGFGAVRNVPQSTGGPPLCQVTIDVAPRQTIRVQAGALPGKADVSPDELCRSTSQVASLVMTTVVATASR